MTSAAIGTYTIPVHPSFALLNISTILVVQQDWTIVSSNPQNQEFWGSNSNPVTLLVSQDFVLPFQLVTGHPIVPMARNDVTPPSKAALFKQEHVSSEGAGTAGCSPP